MTTWNDEYTGPRWTYGSIHRPFTNMFHVFEFIIWSNKEHPDYPVFGTMQTTKELPPDKIADFGLILVRGPE